MIMEILNNYLIHNPPIKQIKVKSDFAYYLEKMCPPIDSSEIDLSGSEGIYASFTGIPIEIDDEIEGDYEPVYREENE